ncbi:hypothetical protein [Streptomyces corynorhini]|uniref:hypothetical protein n=1 Tax=Streptomyces corynorhini TaxID=2282652 RepID=UPI001F3F7411|nr:hypothetical protein [Streptomyces corynorhini]
MQLPRGPSNVAHPLVAAFPTRLAGDVQSVLTVMPEAGSAPMTPFEVEVRGETVAIPSRIHHEEPVFRAAAVEQTGARWPRHTPPPSADASAAPA